MSISTNNPIINANALSVLTLKKQIKALTETLNQQAETLLEQMEGEGLKEITVEGLGKINYKALQEKLIVDSARLKTTYNQIYQDCVKVSTTKAHLEYRLNK